VSPHSNLSPPRYSMKKIKMLTTILQCLFQNFFRNKTRT
jgi:hypothetical protein